MGWIWWVLLSLFVVRLVRWWVIGVFGGFGMMGGFL